MPSTHPVYIISLMWQHVSTAKGNFQGSGVNCMNGNVYSFNFV